MTSIVFEFYASLERTAGSGEYRLQIPGGLDTVAGAIAQLTAERPELAGIVERCACVSGDTIIRRGDALPADGRIALLPPVAGG